MSSKSIANAIASTLEARLKLDDWHKGSEYENAVKNLKLWMNELLNAK